MKKIEAVIFDMDGVLVDSEEFYQERRSEFLVSQGLTVRKIPMNQLIGLTFKKIFPKLVENSEQFSEKKVAELEEAYKEFKKQNIIPYETLLNPEVKEVVKKLKAAHVKVAIASSSTKIAIDKMVAQCELEDEFDLLVSGQDFKETKPNPEIYTYTVQALGVMPENCVVIEDSEAGIAAAVNAQLEVWALVDSRYQMNQEKANQKIYSLKEVLKVLTK
ncbi:HAD family hydrolase [Vagococcus entomophilus]|uniref:HAD family hydrolase n=1 Tax=Vagococcus entomophilus TaxID=1160095 RepID=A0A430AJ07_9ENTE|nr:HAD family phosphatase [Vagococcus entomophilus]RSU07993.1 hypothetical protein CBF30_01770 [Vagococcus entomophilus]